MCLRIEKKDSVRDMRIGFEAGFEGVGVEFSSKIEVGRLAQALRAVERV